MVEPPSLYGARSRARINHPDKLATTAFQCGFNLSHKVVWHNSHMAQSHYNQFKLETNKSVSRLGPKATNNH